MPTASSCVEDLLGLVAAAGDLVALDLAVVGEGVHRLLRHGVDGVGDDEVGDVEGVGVVGVLDAGRGPQRALRVGAGLGQLLPAVAGDDLLEGARRRRRALATAALPFRAVRLVGADLVEPVVDLGVDAGDEERRDRLDAWPGRGRRRGPAPGRSR